MADKDRHFFLNEQHELSRTEREMGGGLPKFGQIDWQKKQTRLARSLTETKTALDHSGDPLSGRRYFLLAKPERTVPKITANRRRSKTGKLDDPVDYAGKDSRVLGRLGLDVISVADEGAIVHATPERLEQLSTQAPRVAELGRMEQSRWAYVAEFSTIPEHLRADPDWLESLGTKGRHDAVIELQPLLGRSEASIVLRTIAESLQRRDGEAIIGGGTDFSGRSWVRALLSYRAVVDIVKRYFSVQAVHPPLFAELIQIGSATSAATNTTTVFEQPTDGSLPVVAVVDSGVAANHPTLEPFRRGTFIHPASAGVFDSHGTFVSSRVVFGDPNISGGEPASAGCRFIDVVVAAGPTRIDGKIVVDAVETVGVNFPDARVFNLSFGDYKALAQYQPVERTNRLSLTQDLDNLIFKRDLLVVVAAGNSIPGLLPKPGYPQNWKDPGWGLGHWAAGFNTLKCGAFAKEWTLFGGLASAPMAPSPFSRVGPGLAEAPVPDFGAHGGNCDSTYKGVPGLGVFGLTPSGDWQEVFGTSFSAPLLSRQCSMALRFLQQFCPAGTLPFSVTVKAFFALTAQIPNLPEQLAELASRTIGFGEASIASLSSAPAQQASFVWQGVLADKTDLARVMFPIPRKWLKNAKDPICEVALAWDPPVNAAFTNVYGCRRVDFRLRPSPDANAIRPSDGAHDSYPLKVRSYNLKSSYSKGLAIEDLWMVELWYSELCDYPPTQTFTPEQRVAIVLRLRDRELKADPQEYVQELPISQTMTRLSAAPVVGKIMVSQKVSQ